MQSWRDELAPVQAGLCPHPLSCPAPRELSGRRGGSTAAARARTRRTVALYKDIITTGGAARNAAIALHALDATVRAVVCAIDSSEPGANMCEIGLTTVSVVTKADLEAVMP